MSRLGGILYDDVMTEIELLLDEVVMVGRPYCLISSYFVNDGTLTYVLTCAPKVTSPDGEGGAAVQETDYQDDGALFHLLPICVWWFGSMICA